MKRFFAFLGIWAIANVSIFAQSVSKETLANVLRLSGDMNQIAGPDTKASFMHLIENNGSVDKSAAQAKLNAYFDGPLYTDLADIVYPYYSDCTEADCQFLIKKFSEPKVKDVLARVASANQVIQKESSEILMAGIQKIAMGSNPDKIEYKNVPDDFRAKFEEYYKVADIGKVMDSAFQSVKQMGHTFPEDQLESFNNMMDKLQSYVAESICPLIANVLVKVVTVDDIQCLVDIYSTEAGKHFTASSGKMAGDAITVGLKVVGKIQESLK
ncbi:MAG: hypothetical protein MJZ13_08315 [Bacteroidales bacterium]|nr:hypothetical protein [Bacteroidales bacterium]